MPGQKGHTAEIPVYFFGCDMGGWHTKKGDALAICKWNEGAWEFLKPECENFFYPTPEKGLVDRHLRAALEANARIIIAIDAALAWPIGFVELVQNAPSANHLASFIPTGSIDNPYLYRETERFVKKYVLTGNKERPLTAPGDKFGNNSSKAQTLAAWFKAKLPNCYCPPFMKWSVDDARKRKHSIIEVYPAASQKSNRFKKLRWGRHSMKTVGKTDIADAKRCVMTAVCYAMEVGILRRIAGYPRIYLPDHRLARSFNAEAITKEGWIFAPYDQKSKKG